MRISKTDCQIAAAFVGALIGAGFASGQELIQFFAQFGSKGLWGVVLAGTLFAVLGGLTIIITKQNRLKTYRDLLDLTVSPGIARAADWMIMTFLFLGTCVMLSGSGALFKEYLGLKSVIGVFLTEFLVFLALVAGDEGVIWFNVLTIPLLIGALLVVSLASLATAPASFTGYSPISASGTWVCQNWVVSSLLYVSYNMVSGVVILVALADKKADSGAGSGVIGGLGLFVLAFSATLALLVFQSSVEGYEIPMLYLAFQVSPAIFSMYGVVLWIAMLTTAVADAYGLCKRLEYSLKIPYLFIMFGMLVLVIPFSLCNFSKLVGRVYPLFGYLSMALTFIIAAHGLKIILRKLQ